MAISSDPALATSSAAQAVALGGDSRSEAEKALGGFLATIDALQTGLIECQRQALLGQVSAMIAHEFRNLMAPLVMGGQHALATNDTALMRSTLERTLGRTQKALQIAERLLQLARGDGGERVACAVATAVRMALESFARPFDRDGIDVRVQVPEDLRVLAAEVMFEQVLLNLLVNARTAMRETRGVLTITARRDGPMVVIEVRDHGPGIPRGEIEEHYNPFLAADPGALSGWRPRGLGLMVCRTIVHQNAATLRILPPDGRGCTFELRWPAADERRAAGSAG